MPCHLPFNINENVRVKLTARGREIHRQRYEPLCAKTGLTYRPKTEDADGWSVWQLWDLMNLFGSAIQLGKSDLPFSTQIEVNFHDEYQKV